MSWKDLIFESEDKPKTTAPPVAAPPTQTAVPSVTGYIPTPTGGASSSAYQRLHDATDFDTTNAGQILKKYLGPLASLPIEEGLKFKTAAAEAAQHEKLTVDTIISTFDGLKSALMAEEAKFKEFISSTTAREIGDRTTKINTAKTQIEALQQQLVSLSTELTTAQGKIDHAQSDFQMALATRRAEIEQQQAHYASVLK